MQSTQIKHILFNFEPLTHFLFNNIAQNDQEDFQGCNGVEVKV